MGCCSPNKILEKEFVNNPSKIKNYEDDEINSTIINNENKINKDIDFKIDKIKDIDIISDKSNKEENNLEKLKQEKIKNKEESGFSLISSSERDNTTKITESDYQNVLSLYPELTSENKDKIEIKKNIILDDKSVYYGEFNINL